MIAANIFGGSNQPVICLILRKHTALHSSVFSKGFRFEADHSRNGIGAVLKRSWSPDNFGIIYCIRVNENAMFITPLKILLSFAIEKRQHAEITESVNFGF